MVVGLLSVGCAAPSCSEADQLDFERLPLAPLELAVLVGSVGQSGSTDGVGSAARFGDLFGVATGPTGDAFVIEALAVRKIGADGQQGGTVAFIAPSTGEYLVYLGTPNVPFRTDGEALACSRYLSASRVQDITGGTCEKFRGVYLLPQTQAGARVRIRLGQLSPQSWVRMLVLPR